MSEPTEMPSAPVPPTSPKDWTPEQVRLVQESYLALARSLSAGTAAKDSAFRRFVAAYPRIQSPTDMLRAAFDRAAAPFTDPGVIVAAAEMYAIAVRAGEVLDREVQTDTFWLESRQFMAWIPPSPGGALPPAMVPAAPAPKPVVMVRVAIGGLELEQEIREDAKDQFCDALVLAFRRAAPTSATPAFVGGSDRCRS